MAPVTVEEPEFVAFPLTKEAKAAAAAADVPPALVAVIETLADVVACSISGAGDNDVVEVGDEQSLCKLSAGEAEA